MKPRSEEGHYWRDVIGFLMTDGLEANSDLPVPQSERSKRFKKLHNLSGRKPSSTRKPLRYNSR